MASIIQIRKDRSKLLEALKDIVCDQIPDAFDRSDVRYLKALKKEIEKWIDELKDQKDTKDNT